MKISFKTAAVAALILASAVVTAPLAQAAEDPILQTLSTDGTAHAEVRQTGKEAYEVELITTTPPSYVGKAAVGTQPTELAVASQGKAAGLVLMGRNRLAIVSANGVRYVALEPGYMVHAMAFSKGGTRLFVTARCYGSESRLTAFDVSTGNQLWQRAGEYRQLATFNGGLAVTTPFGYEIMDSDGRFTPNRHEYLKANTGEVPAIAASSDGSSLVLSYDDHLEAVLPDGKRYLARATWTASPNLSADGKRAAYYAAGYIHVVDSQTSQPIESFPSSHIVPFAFSADGKKLLTAGPGSGFGAWHLP